MVQIVLLGNCQDGGIPHAGCFLKCCLPAYEHRVLHRHPVALGVLGDDRTFHLFEATPNLPHQIYLFNNYLNLKPPIRKPDQVFITHAHFGHIQGLGFFGRETLNAKDIKVHTSDAVHKFIQNTPAWNIVVDNLEFVQFDNMDQANFPKAGFKVTPIFIPHRQDMSDTVAFTIETNEGYRILFLPDHDTWEETLGKVKCTTIREWFQKLQIDVALIDATFFTKTELASKRMMKIPHPSVKESCERLGPRRRDDPRVVFIHLNHTNPLHRLDSPEAKYVLDLGWEIGWEGQTFDPPAPRSML